MGKQNRLLYTICEPMKLDKKIYIYNITITSNQLLEKI